VHARSQDNEAEGDQAAITLGAPMFWVRAAASPCRSSASCGLILIPSALQVTTETPVTAVASSLLGGLLKKK
jgi:hypothetical protein